MPRCLHELENALSEFRALLSQRSEWEAAGSSLSFTRSGAAGGQQSALPPPYDSHQFSIIMPLSELTLESITTSPQSPAFCTAVWLSTGCLCDMFVSKRLVQGQDSARTFSLLNVSRYEVHTCDLQPIAGNGSLRAARQSSSPTVSTK
jgi:hypothetical protein